MFHIALIITVVFSIALALTILKVQFFKSSASKFFAYAILVLALLMSNMILYELSFFETYDVFKIVYDIEWLFLFPVFIFFFYTKKIKNHFHNYKSLKLFYVPFLFSVILNVINVLERDFGLFDIKTPVLIRIRNHLFFFENSFIYMFIFFIMGWLFLIMKQYASQENIKWLWRLWIFMISLILIWIGFNFLESVFFVDSANIFGSILSVGISVFIYWIAYHVIYRDQLKLEVKEINAIITSKPLLLREKQDAENKKISNPHLVNFESLLRKQFIYRDPNLTREHVADLLGISPGYLSQLITLNGSENFSNYINRFRVEETKQMLCNSTFDKYNIESIGLEAGFSSKSTFFKTFKKFTGLTPNAFKNSNQ